MSTLKIAPPRAVRKPTRARLPRYVNVFVDRLGKQRSYFRRNGIRIALHGEIGSPEWWAVYAAALGGEPATAAPKAAPRIRPGTVGALIAAFVGQSAFGDLTRSTRRSYTRPLAVLREWAGDLPVAKLENQHVRKVVEAEWRKSLGAGNAMLVAIRALQKIAQAQGHPALDWTIGLHKRRPADRDGHHIWLAAEIAAYRAAHPLGLLARLVFELALGTGARRADLTRLGRQHISGGKIRFVPAKTKRRTNKPAVAVITPELQAALDLVPHDRLTFITGPAGQAITADHLGDLFQMWARAAGLPDRCRLHGLRKHLGSLLASKGAREYHVGAVLGITDPGTIAVYTRGREVDELAEAAFAHLNAG
jgi:integrase